MKHSHLAWVWSAVVAMIVCTLTLPANRFTVLHASDPSAHCDDDDEEDIEDRMEKVHNGRRSPYQQLRQSLALDRPDWNVVLRQAPQVEAMARKLQQSKNDSIRDSSDGYATSARDLIRHAQARDLLKTRKALVALGDSCGDCHFQGGVGGRLDD